ncbi:Tim44/TimA family putative adaptor protein [Rhodoligotrophos defluvii]|uniref:Tim44/TimA family putative adaptor protein n=1 Tax=Rhodoligotrophos defluvii TaxID=2561934 RepID=UPI0010C9E70E|nr:Tim44/TimA family putative adaptor protein [Rhodoligotrophos defluvii]
MNEAFDPLNLLLLGVAVVIFLRLRSVLGRRTGNERPPVDPFARTERDRAKAPAATQDGKVVTLPQRDGRPSEPVAVMQNEEKAAVWKGYAEEGSAAAAGLDAIARADASFTPKGFLEGARAAYEMIVVAFAEGDRLTLRNLLSKDVFDGFSAALDEREREGLVNETTFVGIDQATITDARLVGRQASVTVRFASQLITTIKNRAGDVVDGDPKKIRDVVDVWTFSRDVKSRDPNWSLVATEAPSA